MANGRPYIIYYIYCISVPYKNIFWFCFFAVITVLYLHYKFNNAKPQTHEKRQIHQNQFNGKRLQSLRRLPYQKTQKGDPTFPLRKGSQSFYQKENPKALRKENHKG